MNSEDRTKTLKKFLQSLNLECDNLNLLNNALTHSSFTYEKGLSSLENYERLEFLGDAVLKLTVSEYLYETFPDYNEGRLSKIRSIIVSDAYLARFAEDIELGTYLNIGPAEEKQGGRKRSSNLACAFEAMLGAFYLDNKLTQVQELLYNLIREEVHIVDQNETLFNPKAILQEHSQAKYKTLPEYSVISESGPAHKKTFTVEVKTQDGICCRAEGHTKKEAQQKAAYETIKVLGLLERD